MAISFANNGQFNFESGMVSQYQKNPQSFGELETTVAELLANIQEEIDIFFGAVAESLSEAIDTEQFAIGKKYIATCLPIVINLENTRTGDLLFHIRDRRHFTSVTFKLSHQGSVSISDIEGLPFWVLCSIVTSYTTWADLRFAERPN